MELDAFFKRSNQFVILAVETNILRGLLAEIEQPIVRIDGRVMDMIKRLDGSSPSVDQQLLPFLTNCAPMNQKLNALKSSLGSPVFLISSITHEQGKVASILPGNGFLKGMFIPSGIMRINL